MNDLVFSTSMLFNTNNDNGCLKQIECDSFYIASYQRGYKWGDEPIQILFDDLYDAFKSSKNSKKSQEYYLQYITVKKIEYNKKKYLEIIDGQQRVTTLSILYSVLNNRDIIKNKIKYAVRSKVQEYIDNRIYKDYQLPSSWEALISEQEDYNEQETGNIRNIIDAIDIFGADRIGHGTAAGESIETMLYIKEKNVCVEVCPISNRLSKAVKENNYHPVLQFIEHGVPFVLCSDNPSIHNKSINDDYLSFYHESKRKDILDEMFKIQNKYKFLKV